MLTCMKANSCKIQDGMDQGVAMCSEACLPCTKVAEPCFSSNEGDRAAQCLCQKAYEKCKIGTACTATPPEDVCAPDPALCAAKCASTAMTCTSACGIDTACA